MRPGACHADEAGAHDAIEFKLELNGEVMQEASTADLIHSVPELIAHLSTLMTLEPGDVIATGRRPASGSVREPRVWLKPGDEVVISSPTLGELRTTIELMDERVERGMRRQLDAAPDDRIGWKLALNAPAIMEALGIGEPALGWLSRAQVVGGRAFAGGRTQPAVEPELLLEAGEDGGVARMGVALEVVDFDRPLDDLEEVIAANIFHRAVALGALAGSSIPAGRLHVNGEERARVAEFEPPAETLAFVARFLQGRVGGSPRASWSSPARSRPPRRWSRATWRSSTLGALALFRSGSGRCRLATWPGDSSGRRDRAGACGARCDRGGGGGLPRPAELRRPQERAEDAGRPLPDPVSLAPEGLGAARARRRRRHGAHRLGRGRPRTTGSPTALIYCRLKRGASACDVRHTLRAGPESPYNTDYGGPRIVRVGNQLVAFSQRYPIVVDKPDGGSSSTVWAWTSNDGGTTWSDPAIVGNRALGDMVVIGSSDSPVILNFAYDAVLRALPRGVPVRPVQRQLGRPRNPLQRRLLRADGARERPAGRVVGEPRRDHARAPLDRPGLGARPRPPGRARRATGHRRDRPRRRTERAVAARREPHRHAAAVQAADNRSGRVRRAAAR